MTLNPERTWTSHICHHCDLLSHTEDTQGPNGKTHLFKLYINLENHLKNQIYNQPHPWIKLKPFSKVVVSDSYIYIELLSAPLEVIINKYKPYTRNVYCKQYKTGGGERCSQEVFPILFLIPGI